MTALAKAFEKNGVHPRDVQFDIAVAKYLEAGGSIAAARDRLSKIEETIKQNGGAFVDLPTGQSSYASPGSRDGSDQVRHASDGQKSALPPSREPSPQQRRAAADVRNVVSLTVLDTFKIRDGRAIGDVRFGEIKRLRTANAAEASIFQQIEERYAHAEHDSKLRDLLTVKIFQRMQQRAAEVADAS